MDNWKKSYVNGKSFPKTKDFGGILQYRIAAECGGYVLGVTIKGDCAVWTGEYKENGELCGVCWGHYFTGADYGKNPNDLYADAFACFTELIDNSQDKIYSLVSYDIDYGGTNVEKTFTSKYAAVSQGEKDVKEKEYSSFMVLNEKTYKFVHIDDKFPISALKDTFDKDILRLNGYSDDNLDLTQEQSRGR